MQVYIEAKSLTNSECIVVLPGDRLGLFLEYAPGAVAYTFDIAVSEVLGSHIGANRKVIQLNEVFDGFGYTTFPYDFSMAAYLDLGNFP